MAGYRKLGRTSDQRKAMIRSQVTALLYHGHIKTTETRAKEIRKVAEGLIAMAVREKDNFETVKAVSYTHLVRTPCLLKLRSYLSYRIQCSKDRKCMRHLRTGTGAQGRR